MSIASKIAIESEKWLQTYRVSWSNQLIYKTNFVLVLIGPGVVFFLIKYNLWSSIYGLEELKAIQGYSLEAMLQYQAWVMVVGFLAQGFNSRNLAEDIRLGRISSYLIYPFDFWKFHTSGFLALQSAQSVVALFTILSLSGLGFLPELTVSHVLLGWVYTALVGFLWFSIQFALGLMAFWLEETWVLRVIFLTSANFFSGAIIPLELFPDWLVRVIHYTPFPYLTFVPVKVFMRTYDGNILWAFLTLGAWLIVVAFVARLIWRSGIRLYSAAGM